MPTSVQPSTTLLSSMAAFMNDDLDKLEDELETSDDPMIQYMNDRVDTIMDRLHTAMDHRDMGGFMRMMLLTPVAAVLINVLGLPVEATALLGLVVPMFLMQRVGHSEHQSVDGATP